MTRQLIGASFMAGLSMPPLASLLIGMLGWRGAYLVLGALALALGGDWRS